MKSFRFLPAALLFAAPLCAFRPCDSQQNSQEQAQAIRINVDRVNVGVIVTDASGHFVESLHREDFHVFDNGIEQPLTDFAAIEEPAQVLRSEEHTSELQSPCNLVCRLLLEKKKIKKK